MLKEIKYPYAEAYMIALEVLEQLKPHCERVEIAGSIRRKKNEVGDIEIVAIPKPYSTGLLESGIATVINQWQKVKGELPCKYTQRILPSGIKLDLFFAEEGNWGLTFALRTGSADYSHKVLANGWVRQGFKSDGGYLFKEGERYEVREEKDLFKLIGIPFVEPEYRNLQVNQK
jgi:DNA polymerase/3'-5' exonuclease PolX